MNVLLTNDDGIDSPGLRALRRAFSAAGHKTFAVAPARQRSGAAHSITVFEPLRAFAADEGELSGFGVHGTPADCVKLGLGQLAPFAPDLVVSGINQGPNAGPDICYSGTVGAAAEAAFADLPSLAVSHGDPRGCAYIDEVATHAVKLAEKINWKALPRKRIINLNYPDLRPDRLAGLKICAQARSVWDNAYLEHRDPRGLPYWWLNCELIWDGDDGESDRRYLARGYATITPLKFDFTDYECVKILEEMNLEKDER